MRGNRTLVAALILAISVPAAAQNHVPTAFRSLKPHQIVEAVAAERAGLSLTAAQERQLDSLHLVIRGERHRYVTTGPSKVHQSYRMLPMISRERAYANALAILTLEQRARAGARFTSAEYRLPTALRQEGAFANDGPDPLRHHVAGASPVIQGSKAPDFGKDPLSHRE